MNTLPKLVDLQCENMMKEVDSPISLINNIDSIANTLRSVDHFAEIGDSPALTNLKSDFFQFIIE